MASASPVSVVPSQSEIHERALREAAEVDRLERAQEDALHGTKLSAVLAYGLCEESQAPPATALLRAVRLELAGFARLATVAAEASAADLVSLSQHIGQPLEGFVRRIDVVLELLERQEAGRLARKARREARKTRRAA